MNTFDFSIIKRFIIFSLVLFVPLASFAAQVCDSSINKTQLDAIYRDNNDGTVLDTETGLMWQKCSLGQVYNTGDCTGTAVTKNWKEALESAQTLNSSGGASGYTDWRLPSIAELVTLIEFACSPPVNATIFPNPVSGIYWSSTPAYTQGGAWEAGASIIPNDKNISRYVRLVRRGR